MLAKNNQLRKIFLRTGLLVAAALLFTAAAAGCKPSFPGPEATEQTTAVPETTTEFVPETTAEPSPTPQPTPEPLPPSLENPVIALTFDDGPSLLDTGGLLDLLAAEEVKATFFVLGSQIERDAGRAELLRRAWEEGHEIANHSYSHMIFPGEEAAAVREELAKTSQLIESITGQSPAVMRPPTGAYDDQLLEISRDLGLAIVNWSWQSCPEDWNHKEDPEYIAGYVIANAANGHIILLHDTNSATVASMQDMITGLKERGFRFATVSELLAWQGEGHPVAGEVYHQYTP